MPKWGYARMQLTDLDLYADYVKKETPGKYYDNGLVDLGCQCDGKDFMTESFKKIVKSTEHRNHQKLNMHHSDVSLGLLSVDWCRR